ncbi:MAG: 4Fe-4S dicluster domain-containing protein, partial [Desulfobacterales bacterium]|nr:4Fe-4S dicluster domain-containing protein [Desulfobacterales bacterium]
PVWPADMEKYLNPKVSPRMRGVVEKCSFCFHRYQQARDKAYLEKREEIAENEYQTACAEACPTGAITFGDLNNKNHAVYKLKNSPKAFRLLERLETNPKVYYLTSKKWVRKAGDNYLTHEEPGKIKNNMKEHH